MQSYEELFSALEPLNKTLKDAAAAVVRHQKSLEKHTAAGNLPEARKSLAALDGVLAQLRETCAALGTAVDGFDVRGYFADGDFAQQLLSECAARGVDVQGEKGVYEMFPFKVRILGDAEHEPEVYVNRKKLASCRPSFIAEQISASRSRLRPVSAASRKTLALPRFARIMCIPCTCTKCIPCYS